MIFLLDLIGLIFIFICWPFIIIYGWVRWISRDLVEAARARISMAGHSLATLAFVLALASVLFSFTIGGFQYWDGSLIKLYKWGILLSLAGLLLGGIGMFRPGPLRWLAPLGSLSSLLFWLGASLGE